MAHVQYTSETYNVNGKEVEVFKVNHDVNGNPRYVIHFLAVLPRDHEYEPLGASYAEAVNIIHSIGGRKYTAKWFGGGLVFSSYNVREDLKRVIPEVAA